MNEKELNRKIDSLGKKTAKWRDDVQIVLVQCVYHAITYKNVDPCTRLVGVMTGADMKAIIHWLENHAPVVWIKSEEKFRFNKSFVGEYDATSLLGDAWWIRAIKPRDVSSTLDCLDAIRSLIKRLEKEIEAGKREVVHPEAIEELKAVCGRIERAE
jgi:hypothetical protein